MTYAKAVRALREMLKSHESYSRLTGREMDAIPMSAIHLKVLLEIAEKQVKRNAK